MNSADMQQATSNDICGDCLTYPKNTKRVKCISYREKPESY